MPDQGVPSQPKLITELKASAHLMLLDAGTFCIFHVPGGPASSAVTGLPGVRLSLPPLQALPGAVRISTFRDDGWIGGSDGAALIRVEGGSAQILVTVYQAADGAQEAPRLQVMRLTEDPLASPRDAPAGVAAAPVQAGKGRKSGPIDVFAHVHGQGDTGGAFGDWIGERGNKCWIEGYAIAAPPGIAAEDMEYQAVLGRDWLSPWSQAGQFCGSRGMSLPILGLRVRLRGKAAESYDVLLTATFVDGSSNGPVDGASGSQSDALSPLEAFRVELRPRTAPAEGAAPAKAPKRAKPQAGTPPQDRKQTRPRSRR